MYSIIDIVLLLKNQFPTLNIYPLAFPIDSPDNSVVIDLSSNSGMVSKQYDLNVQVKVREVHPEDAERISKEIRNFLEGKTNFYVGQVQIVLAKASTPYPLYMGLDGSGNYLYSNNFRFIVNEGV